MQRTPQDVGVDLHHERVLEQPAGDHQVLDRHPGRLERLDDRARAERGRLDQRAVHLRRPRAQREPDDHAAELVVDQHRAVAAVPVERHEPVLADLLLARQPGQVLVQRDAPLARPARGTRGADEVVHEPAEDVADPALAGLVAPQPGRDPAEHGAAHPRHLGERRVVHHVAGRRAHDRHHLSGPDRLRRGRGDVRVDVAHRDGDALGQPGPRRRLAPSGSPARPPSGESGCSSLSATKPANRSSSAARYASDGYAPSWRMPL